MYMYIYFFVLIFFFSAAKPVITQRTKVVIEELIDGKVVSRTEDVDTEIIKK